MSSVRRGGGRRVLGDVNTNVNVEYHTKKEAEDEAMQAERDTKTCGAIRQAMNQAMARKSGFAAFRRSFHLNGNLHAMSRQRSGSQLRWHDVEQSVQAEGTPPKSAYEKVEPASPSSTPDTGTSGSGALDSSGISDACSSANSSFSDTSAVLVLEEEYDETRTFSREQHLMPATQVANQQPPQPTCSPRATTNALSTRLPTIPEGAVCSVQTNATNTGAPPATQAPPPATTATSPSPATATTMKKKPPTPRHPRWRTKSNVFRLASLNKELSSELTAASVAKTIQPKNN
ncbi:hypothetical protein PTSG_05586 [Salpingoeca rosetta]|uniref:Uncharacterized protein n=1 Tax=Salpingoeca rosetta (strain ATCC 50818 / BSB-021) TaxID=946362 RepID=F2UBM5_SALR5|nr:uncharacterized protein PTSG_05586 [Salpingoeca rosetta]EGD73891.1 hypothetical protein PTSG_05586 [Salpingoeca rosetta]|eukprot:XP_004993454.1 hypothetical protein PTSG_05586 [Salpingoeca rosetta]